MKGNIPPGGGIDPQLRAAIQRLVEISDTGEGNRGDPRERYLKVKDAIDLGWASLVGRGGLTPGGGGIGGGDGPGSSVVPPRPEDLHTAPGFGYVFVAWRRPLDLYNNHGYTEVWRLDADVLADAVLIAQVAPGGIFADYNTTYGQIYYYWIRFVSAAGVVGPWFSPNGVPGQEVTDPTELLERLIGQIRETHLYSDLLGRINLIDAPDTGLIDRLAQEIADRIAEIAGLDARITPIEGEIIEHESEITSLQSSVGDLESDQSASASAISELNTRVTTNDGLLSTQSSQITTLTTNLASAQNDADANATAISGLDSRITQTESGIASQSTLLTNLSAHVDGIENDVDGTANAVTALDARVTQNESDITVQSSLATNLQSLIDDAEDEIIGLSNAQSLLDTRVTNTESSITSQASLITNLQADIEALDVDGNASAISALDTRVTDAEGEVSALSAQITSLNSSLDAAEGDISANAGAIASLTSRVTSAEGNISSISGDITYLTSEVTNLNTGQTANSTAIDSLETRADANESEISAQATATTQVNARLNDFGGSGVTVEQKLTATANSITGMEGQYTLKIDANGFIAGFGASIESVNGEYVSSFIINANQFAMISPSGVQKVSNMAVSGTTLLVTTESPHGYEEGDDVQFTWVNEEDWLGVTLSISQVDTATVFRVPIGGRSTPLTANVLGNLKPITTLTRSGTTATAIFAQPHGLSVGSTIDISRANQEAWLGSHLVTAIPNSTTARFTVPSGYPTPVTASVRVSKVAIPFVVEGDKVVIDGAYIKEATINTAHIDYVNVTKIEGLDLNFLSGTFGTLTADKIEGDVNKVYSTSTDTTDRLLINGAYVAISTLSIETQTRPRYPFIFAKMNLSAPTVKEDVNLEMVFFRRNLTASPASSGGTTPVTGSGSVTSITSARLQWQKTIAKADPMPGAPPGWVAMGNAEMCTVSLGSATCVFKPSGPMFSNRVDAGPSNDEALYTVPFEWAFFINVSSGSIPDAGNRAFSYWNSGTTLPYALVQSLGNLYFPRVPTGGASYTQTLVDQERITYLNTVYVALRSSSGFYDDITVSDTSMKVMMLR